MSTSTAIPPPGEWEQWHANRSERHHAGAEDLVAYSEDNPVVATLLGPDGEPIRQWRRRPPPGFRRRADDWAR